MTDKSDGVGDNDSWTDPEPGLNPENAAQEPLKATPLTQKSAGNYMGNLGSEMQIDILISGGHRCGKVGAAQHFIDSIIERFGDDRPIQVEHTVGDKSVHSKRYNQTVTASRAYAPLLTVTITEDSK